MITCSICVMDESCAPFTSLGEKGCNHCQAARLRMLGRTSGPNLELLLRDIKSQGSREFDCVIGVSGGLDSSYLLVRAVELGLKPLAVHMDNNWNSSMASRNIRRMLDKLGVPLITVVTDWQMQKNLQIAFLRSDVVDIELLYDNALHSVCYSVARRFGIKTILGGANNATEGVEVPKSWVWRKFDGRNIRSIAKASGAESRGFPIFTGLEWLFNTLILRIRWTSLLDAMPEYGREEALSYLTTNYGYTPYGSKHYENIFTRFYQGHILPTKFGIDKRRPHLSSEIVAGKLTRGDAILALDAPIYQSQSLLELDYRYVVDKLGMTSQEMEGYLTRESRGHEAYKQDLFLMFLVPALLKTRRGLLRALGL